MKRAYRITLLLALTVSTLTLGGCTPKDGILKGNEPVLPPAYSERGGERVVEHAWWRAFGDERLNAVMDKALTGNLDLKTSFERLRAARAAAGIAHSSLIPSLTLKGYGGRGKQASTIIDLDPSGTYRASLGVQYEIDIWRRLTKRARAGRLEALATNEEVRALHGRITAEVADTYFLLLERSAQLKLALDSEAGYKDTLERVELHYREGLTSSESLYLARRSLSTVKARRLLIEADIKRAGNALALLTGRHSLEELTWENGPSQLPAPPAFKAGLPSTLLKERPDIQAAHLKVKAKDSLLAAAIAERFPSFSLTAEYGGSSEKLQNLLKSPNILWSMLINAAMPVIDGRRRALDVERARALLKEALFDYQKTVLSAFRDVEDALSQSSAASKRVLELKEHTKISMEALRRAETDYLQGLTGYLPVIEAQNILNSSMGGLISARLAHISSTIALARALGGGWSGTEVKDLPAAKSK